MARVRAIVSFAGTVTMGRGEERDIPYGDVLDDLIAAGYVEEISPEAKVHNPSVGAADESVASQKKRGAKK